MTRKQSTILIMLVLANALVVYGVLRLLADQRRTGTPDPVAIPSTSATIPPADVGEVAGTRQPTQTATFRPEIHYTVEAGDSLIGIAEKFNTSLEVMLIANPQLNAAALIYPGDEIVIPSPDQVFTPAETPSWPATGQIRLEYGGLPLRELPGSGAAVLFNLSALTPITIVGRTSDYTWLQIETQYGDRGWVPEESIDAFIGLDQVAVLTSVVVTPVPADQETSGSAPPASYPYLSGLNENLLEIFELGQQLGNRPDVFSKVGDSITISGVFLTPVGTGRYSLGQYTYLQPVIDYFSETYALTNNSFANFPLAAKEGWGARMVLRDGMGDERYCGEFETPLECEYRLVKPMLALIMLGTNDLPGITLDGYELSMRQIIEYSLEQGVIPVISTIPPIHRDSIRARVAEFNALLEELSSEYRVPLWDYWAAVINLPNQGMWFDGVHPSPAPAGHNADFQPQYLGYGYTIRNLTALQALDAVWRYLGLEAGEG